MTPDHPRGGISKRRCPICETFFVAHPRKPNHTYCSGHCRNVAWSRAHPHRRRHRTDPTVPNATHVAANEVSNQASNDIVNDDTTTNRETNDVNRANAVQSCPHCRQPIALITLIVPPAAAHVTVPQPPPVVINAGDYRGKQTRPATTADTDPTP